MDSADTDMPKNTDIPKWTRRQVDQYDMKGVYIRTWKSQGEAGRELLVNPDHIRRCCQGDGRRSRSVTALSDGHRYQFAYHGGPSPGQYRRREKRPPSQIQGTDITVSDLMTARSSMYHDLQTRYPDLTFREAIVMDVLHSHRGMRSVPEIRAIIVDGGGYGRRWSIPAVRMAAERLVKGGHVRSVMLPGVHGGNTMFVIQCDDPDLALYLAQVGEQ